jgi:uncharacterized protein (DUF488 family)
MESPPGRLFSVGHSNHEVGDLLRLLRGAGVTAVADVRSSPYSRRRPQFNRGQFQSDLAQSGVEYVFLGDLLGGRPDDPGLYSAESWVDYEAVRATPEFRLGLDRLLGGLERFTVAMLCAEEDPLDCHRGLMITPALVERGCAPLHLRKGGWVETTEEMERRLLKEAGLDDAVGGGLFPLGDDEHRRLVAEAYRLMNRKKAYRLPGGGEG